MANGTFGGGDGNASTPFLVEDGADLNAVRNNLGKAYKQVANVDLSAYANFVPIGNASSSVGSFTGIYDGGGFTIANLKIDFYAKYVGLFGYNTGTIKGVNVISGLVTGNYSSSSSFITGVCGYSNTTITNCSNRGCEIVSQYNSNTACGVTSSPSIDCFNTATVRGSNAVGVCHGTPTRCYNSGSIIGDVAGSGAIAGVSVGDANNCYNTGSVTQTGTNGSTVYGVSVYSATNCYNTGILTGTTVNGICSGVPTRCYNLATSIHRRQGSSSTTSFFKISGVAGTGNYALDTMVMAYD